MKRAIQRHLSQTLVLAVTALSLGLTTFVQAQDGPGGSKMGPQAGRQRPSAQQLQQMKQQHEAKRQQLYQQLNITDEQAAKLKAVREKNQGQVRALRQESMTKRKALSQYMASPDADPAKAMTLQKDLAATNQRLEEQRLKGWFEMRKNLTPEQLTKLQSLRQQHQNKRSQMGNRTGGQRMGVRPTNGGIIPPGNASGQ